MIHRDRMRMLIAVLVSLVTRSPCFAFSPATTSIPLKSLKCPILSTLPIKCSSVQIPIHRNLPYYGYVASVKALYADVDDNNADATGASADAGVLSSTGSDTDNTSFLSRIKAYFTKKPNDGDGLSTRQRLAKLGFAVLLSYGFVSNMSAMIFLSLAWFSFSTKTGLSPLAPGQWKPFTLVYAGFYVLSNLVRPLRIGIAVTIGKYFESILKYLQDKTNLSRSVSIAILVFGANVVCTLLALALGISLASLFSGVPVFPSKVIVA